MRESAAATGFGVWTGDEDELVDDGVELRVDDGVELGMEEEVDEGFEAVGDGELAASGLTELAQAFFDTGELATGW